MSLFENAAVQKILDFISFVLDKSLEHKSIIKNSTFFFYKMNYFYPLSLFFLFLFQLFYLDVYNVRTGCIFPACVCALSNLLIRHSPNTRIFLSNNGIQKLLELLDSGKHCDIFTAFCIVSCFCAVSRLVEVLPKFMAKGLKILLAILVLIFFFYVDVFPKLLRVLSIIMHPSGDAKIKTSEKHNNEKDDYSTYLSSALKLTPHNLPLLNEFLNRSRAYKDLKEKFEKCAIPKVC
jgi:hypothetical protein